MQTGHYTFSLGHFTCFVFQDDSETYPVSQLAKDVAEAQLKQALLEAGFSAEEYTCSFNCLLIRTGEQTILVDAGWGIGTARRQGQLLPLLQAQGIAPGKVDHIIITHGDNDHVGGVLDAQGNFTYPNADYWMSQSSLDFWTPDRIAQLPPEFTTFGRVILPRIRERLHAIGGDAEFLPGFRAIQFPEHRPGHIALEISSAGETLLHLVDVLGNPVFLAHPQWQWVFDTDSEQAARRRQPLLERAAAQGALVFGTHLPFPGLGHVVQEGQGWRWRPLTR